MTAGAKADGAVFLALVIAMSVAVVVLIATLDSSDDPEAELQALAEEYLDGFVAGDTEAVAQLFAEECGDVESDVAAASEEFTSLEQEVEFNVTGVDVQNLTEESAEFLPEGTVTFDGEEQSITEEDGEYTKVVKEDGDWKFSDCDFFAAEEESGETSE